MRVGSALGSGDRAVNQTDRSPLPPRELTALCVCLCTCTVRVSVCVRVSQTTVKPAHLPEHYGHPKRAWAVTLRRWESWEASEQRGDVPVSGLHRVPLENVCRGEGRSREASERQLC